MNRLDSWPVVSREVCGDWLVETEYGSSFHVRKAEIDHEGPIVYMIQGENTDGPVKIGTSARGDAESRLAGLQTGNPERLEIRRVFQGGKELERALHGAFEHAKIRGEWYMLTKPLSKLLPSNCRSGGSLRDMAYNEGFKAGEAAGRSAGWAEGWDTARATAARALGLFADQDWVKVEPTCPTLTQEAA